MGGLGRKDDGEKRRWDLLPWRQVGEVVDVLTYGVRKYAPDNWKHVSDPHRRYFSAALRHLTAWWEAEDMVGKFDEDTGRSHLAHAICCLLFCMWFDREGRRPSSSVLRAVHPMGETGQWEGRSGVAVETAVHAVWQVAHNAKRSQRLLFNGTWVSVNPDDTVIDAVDRWRSVRRIQQDSLREEA